MTGNKLPLLQLQPSKNIKFGVVVFVLITTAVGCLLLMRSYKSTGPPKASCLSDAATISAPPRLSDLASSPVIVVADASEALQGNYVFTVRENMAGETLNTNSTFKVCSTIEKSQLEFALFFLEGYDENEGMWVPRQFEAGILSKVDGKYRIAAQDKSYSLDEIRQAIKEQK